MIIEIIIALIVGILIGTITGLLPGIHTNLISAILISITLPFEPLALVIFISSMAITHTFLDFIPSIYLGAPDEDTTLSVMPGHSFLLKGRAHKALCLTLIGSNLAVALTIIIIPIFILIIPHVYNFIQRMMGFILIWASIFLLSREKKSKILACIIFILSGFLGFISLNSNASQPLLPLLTGLFGSSTLIYSISVKTKVPKQKIEKLKIDKKQMIKPAIATSLVSPISSFLPGLGSSQAAIIGDAITKLNKEQFLILLGSINTLVMSTSFATLYLINKTRTGAAVAISQLMSIELKILALIIASIIISALVATILAFNLSKLFAKHLHKINYSKISVCVLIFLTLIIAIFTSWQGLAILIVSTILGLFCIYSGIRRGFLMGSLLIPTILFYLPF